MPHYIQTEAMEELQSLFPKEYEITSSHPFRQGNDMQMMFSYIYFLKYYWEEFDLYRGILFYFILLLLLLNIIQLHLIIFNFFL
jgi:hypothetical protein